MGRAFSPSCLLPLSFLGLKSQAIMERACGAYSESRKPFVKTKSREILQKCQHGAYYKRESKNGQAVLAAGLSDLLSLLLEPESEDLVLSLDLDSLDALLPEVLGELADLPLPFFL